MIAWLKALFVVLGIHSEPSTIAYVCTKDYYKVKYDCRMSMVNNHYEKWKANKELIKQTCEFMAHELTCKEI